MKDWIEVFRAGTHTDSKGRTRTWPKADLDKICQSYNPADHEAPAVVGHPRDNHPAYGWVEGLKRVGEKLLAKFKQVAPEFASMVEEGRFKKRSIRVMPDGTLGHVAFLGAVPPAIKGLKDIEFSEDTDSSDYDYSEEEEMMKKTVEELQAELEQAQQKNKTLEKQNSEFKSQIDKTAADFAEEQKKTRRKEIYDFVEAGIKDGKVLPSWKEKGLVEFMSGLDEQGGEFEFSEAGETKKQTSLDWFKGFIADFSAHPLFKEMVKPEGDGDKKTADFEAERKLGEEIASYVTEQK